MSKLNQTSRKVKRQLEEQGYILSRQKEPSYDEPIEVNGQQVKVPFTNSAPLWYLLRERDGQLCYCSRSSEEDFEIRLGVFVDLD
jgi:hypothetical protein